MQFNKEFITRVVPDAECCYAELPDDCQFSIDTRTLQPGEIFIALRGKQTDGHVFVNEAVERGARGLVIAQSQKTCLASCNKAALQAVSVIIVPDTFEALRAWATAWRAQFTYPVIGITGSTGKTTTKELVAQILDLHDVSYLASRGNQNSIYGLALSLLRMRAEHACAIVEMGISKRGEMEKLVAMAKPTAAVITNIGHCHMEGLGSIHDIAQEKRAIFSCFKDDNIGIINGDQPLLSQVAYAHPVIKCGSKTTNQIQARKVSIGRHGISFTLKVYGQKADIHIKKYHAGIVNNILSAAAIAHSLAVPFETIVKGVQQELAISGRFELRSLKNGSGTLIHDAYNANPENVKAALLALQTIETDAHKIVVLGDMLELGVNAPFWHRQLGRFLAKVPDVKDVILVGKHVEWVKKFVPVTVQVDHVHSWQEALPKLRERLHGKACVLVKGSRAMGLDNLVNELT